VDLAEKDSLERSCWQLPGLLGAASNALEDPIEASNMPGNLIRYNLLRLSA